MKHFWAVLGRMMIDPNFWTEVNRRCKKTSRLLEVHGLWNYLVHEKELKLTRYEVMEVNRIVQRELTGKHLEQIRSVFPASTIAFPRDLELCAALGLALVDTEFAAELGRQESLGEIEKRTALPDIQLRENDARTIRRFMRTPPPSGGTMAELLQVANHHDWVKPKPPTSGTCPESPHFSARYLHSSLSTVLETIENEPDKLELIQKLRLQPFFEPEEPEQGLKKAG